MAKLVKVTYGTQGKSAEYTYIVNNNVRAGQFIHPSVRHYESGKIYATTGIVQSTDKPTTERGQAQLKELASKGRGVASAYTAHDLGISGQNTDGLGRAVLDKETGIRKIAADRKFENNPYIDHVRNGNKQLREEYGTTPIESTPQTNKKGDTFESYSLPFMKGD